MYKATNDLRHPVNIIQELMPELQGHLPEENTRAKKVLNEVLLAINSVRTTLSEMSEIRIMEDALTYPQDEVQLAGLIDELKEDMAEAITKSHALVTYSLAVPAVKFSRRNLRSILFNLVSSTINYATSGKTPQVQIISSITADRQIQIPVEVNGSVIDARNHEILFQDFKHQGTTNSGVNLYLVRRLVENGGGTINLESAPGKGTVFTILLAQEMAT